MMRHKRWHRISLILAAVLLAGLGYGIRQTASSGELRSLQGALRQEEPAQEHKPQDGRPQNDGKRIALTFDDGPSAEYTPMLLDGLKERGVKATFFVIGNSAQEHPELLLREYEEGHLIGNHTYDHVNLRHLSEWAACEQVRKTNELIESLTGYRPEFVRPPFGEWHKSIDQDMTMIKVMWNVDPLDWATGNADAVVERVIRSCKENDIILLHDETLSSVQAALRIVDLLQEQGYEFVTVDQLILD